MFRPPFRELFVCEHKSMTWLKVRSPLIRPEMSRRYARLRVLAYLAGNVPQNLFTARAV
jgi:hypothetical protein